MPPIMGAGTFLIAEYTRLPYIDIVRLSVLPAILYFATVYLFVDIIAAKRGMSKGELPKLGQVFRDGWYFLVPLGILIYFLLRNVSPGRVGFVAITAILIVSALRYFVRQYALRVGEAESGPLPQLGRDAVAGLLGALESGARNARPVPVSTASACAVAGIVVGTIGLTSLGLKFSSLMVSFSGELAAGLVSTHSGEPSSWYGVARHGKLYRLSCVSCARPVSTGS